MTTQKPLAERVAFAEKNSALVDKYHLRELLREAMQELAALRQVNDRNVEGAWQSMKDLAAECERRGDAIERLRKAAVLAVVPLEAMSISGSMKLLLADVQEAIAEGIAAVREVIAETAGSGGQ